MAQINCPYCDKLFDAEAEQTHQSGKTAPVRGVQDNEARESLPRRLRDRLPRVVDLRCPHCGREFEYNVDTNEVFRE